MDWNDRYDEEGFAYGRSPNDFLVASAAALRSPVLCLASGEGRNAVWLAEQGHVVHAVDASSVGVAKTRQLATSRGVDVQAAVADLAEFDLGVERWGGLVAIFAHLPPDVRRELLARIPDALVPGGALVLEAYAPEQAPRDTGGPPDASLCYTTDELRAQLRGLHFATLRQTERPVVEGRYHTGLAVVVQAIAQKPA